MHDDCPFFRPSHSLCRDLSAVGIYQELTAIGVYCPHYQRHAAGH
jgi:hypothetical protein